MKTVVAIENFLTRGSDGCIQIATDANCVVEFEEGSKTRKVVGRQPTVVCRPNDAVLRLRPLVNNQRRSYFKDEIDLDKVIRARVIRA